jgi:hypothetical protein
MVALGPNETIVGGRGNDQLGAVGAYDTIKAGPGRAQLYGGPHSTLISGAGGDLLVDTHDDATIQLSSSDNEVVVSGNHDRVLCSPTSQHDVIYANPSDSVDPTCVNDNAQVLPVAQSPFAVLGGRPADVRHTSAVSADARRLGDVKLSDDPFIAGNGSANDPFIADCYDFTPEQDCTAPFPTRSLPKFWQNEYVPSYKCPASHPWLVNQQYEPLRMELLKGVQVNQNFVDVNITGGRKTFDPKANYFTGTLTGFPYSSATSWATAGDGAYQIVLHCTSNRARAFPG